MMLCYPLFVLALVAGPVPKSPQLPDVDFPSIFKKLDGCFVLREVGRDWSLRYRDERCAKRLNPCSTFKIFTALAGLEAGALKDETTLLKWDGSPQTFKHSEKDHTLSSAMRDSVNWYFKVVATQVGAERMARFVKDAAYGNQDASSPLNDAALNDSMKISANEQVAFLENLYTDKLPFDKRHQALVRKILVRDSGDGWTFSGKTGTAQNEVLGWFVGHVHAHGRDFVFAMNIEGSGGASGRVAQRLCRKVLAELNLIPDDSTATAKNDDSQG